MQHYGLPPPEIATAMAASGDHFSIRSPPLPQTVPDYAEFSGAGDVMFRSFAEEVVPETCEEVEKRKGSGNNRWPRKETVALLNILSEMDAAFRNSALKGPLWDDVSMNLAELGYTKSSKKCREKFENIIKYGKKDRFFSPTAPIFPLQSAALPIPLVPPNSFPEPSRPMSSSSASDTDGEETEDAGGVSQMVVGKRKRKGWSWKSKKVMYFFKELFEQVMKQQEAIQQRLLETIEKREQDRILMEDIWKRKEMARLNQEYDLLAQERAVTAKRDAAVISFLQKLTASQSFPEEQKQKMQQTTQQNLCASGSPAPARWPKAEVHALIKLRSWHEGRKQESGPKCPAWEEISMEMQRLGYNRSSKRCKEKWENINKYYKKVKESNKKRPEYAKTCPYFHQLDSLHRKKQLCISIEETVLLSLPEAERTTNFDKQ